MIARFGGALDGVEGRESLTQTLDLSIDRLLVGGRLAPPDLEALVGAQLGARSYADLDRERQRRALLGQVADVDVRLADRRDPGRVDRVDVPTTERAAQRLVEHVFAPEPPNHHRGRHLALAKPWNPQVRAECASRLLNPALDLRRGDLGLQAHARLRKLGDRGGNGGRHRAQTIA